MNQDLSGKAEAPRKPRSGVSLADAKKQCGLCGHRAVKEWRCTEIHKSIEYGEPANYSCPFKGGICPGFLKKPSVIRPPQPKKKGLPVPPGVKFLYFGRPAAHSGPYLGRSPHDHQGVVTVAWIESSPGTLVMGFSFCSPEDPWCKIAGRELAMKRLYEHPLVMPFLYSPKRTVHETVRAVLTHDFQRVTALSPGATMLGTVPSWTKNLAKRLMVSYKLTWLRVPQPPVGIELPLTIIAQMMRDIASLENG